MTAGILPARRVRRAPPLPNSVRGSAGRRTSDTVVLLYSLIWTVAVSLRRGTWPRRQRTNTASITDTACSAGVPSPGNLVRVPASRPYVETGSTELGAVREQVVHPNDVVERGAGLGERGADVAQALLGLGDNTVGEGHRRVVESRRPGHEHPLAVDHGPRVADVLLERRARRDESALCHGADATVGRCRPASELRRPRR